jgi:hypothetical protein
MTFISIENMFVVGSRSELVERSGFEDDPATVEGKTVGSFQYLSRIRE